MIKFSIIFIFLICNIASADVEINFKGKLIEPPNCNINNGEQIDVDFGNKINPSKVNGINYRVPINYQISCDDTSISLDMVLVFSGEISTFDGEAFQTSKNGLGIRVYQNDEIFIPNSAVIINPGNPPKLEAAPIKKEGTILTEGPFEGWANLEIHFQ